MGLGHDCLVLTYMEECRRRNTPQPNKDNPEARVLALAYFRVFFKSQLQYDWNIFIAKRLLIATEVLFCVLFERNLSIMQVINGKTVSKQLYQELLEQISKLKQSCNQTPGLAVVIIGDDPASQVYVNRKVKIAKELGIRSLKYELSKNVSQKDVLDLVHQLNCDDSVDGILVQSPPPAGIDERQITEAINPDKDVDCFHPYNVGKLAIGDVDGFLPCTPAGIMILLHRYQVETEGRHAVVIGRSNIVGKPMTLLLSRKNPNANATVTLCHSRTVNIASVTRSADILVSALGKAEFVKEDMVKNNVVVIDVGINRVVDPSRKSGYRLVGDVDYENVSKKASFITPVPGGVGPMTIAVLMYNTLKAYCLRNQFPLSYRLF